MANAPPKITLTLTLVALGATCVREGRASIDTVFLVDESGSMTGEHAWLADMVGWLDAGLAAAGHSGNRYALVGFGGAESNGHMWPHAHLVSGGDFGTAAQLSAAAGSLTVDGLAEDGWAAIDYAMSRYVFTGDKVNFVLITDEDRDRLDGSLSYNGVLASLADNGVLLNVVVDAQYKDADGRSVLGVDADGNGYLADGYGGYTEATPPLSLVRAFMSAREDYVDMAWAAGGAFWDLNQLRSGGLTAESFTKAFVDVKVQELASSHSSPEPAGLVIWAVFGALSAASWCRKRRGR